MRKILLTLFVLLAVNSIAMAKNSYWVATDKTEGNTYMNVRVIYTTTEMAPTKTTYGKDIEVSSGPFSSKMDAVSNCNNTIKAVRKSNYLVKNYCSQAIQGQ